MDEKSLYGDRRSNMFTLIKCALFCHVVMQVVCSIVSCSACYFILLVDPFFHSDESLNRAGVAARENTERVSMCA